MTTGWGKDGVSRGTYDSRVACNVHVALNSELTPGEVDACISCAVVCKTKLGRMAGPLWGAREMEKPVVGG